MSEQIDLFRPTTHSPERVRSQTTLERAQAELRAKLDEGTTCPCCGKHAKRQKRKIHVQMALFLVGLVRLHRRLPGQWFTYKQALDAVNSSSRSAGDYAYLAQWGLIEAQPHDGDPKKKTSGRWRPTRAGALFAEGRLRVPRFAWVYNNRAEMFSDEETTIQDSLGDRFDFEELLG